MYNKDSLQKPLKSLRRQQNQMKYLQYFRNNIGIRYTQIRGYELYWKNRTEKLDRRF